VTPPCRPCAAYAAKAALYEQPEHRVQPGRFRAAFPPRGYFADQVFNRCAPTTVDVCAAHRRWSVWPTELYLALMAETEAAGAFSPPALTALDDMLRAKAAGFVPKSRTSYGAWPGEDPAAVIAAWKETGSYAAAGRLLDKRGVPTRKGKPWQPSMVAWIVQLQGVQL
jgi:hypothetical protein